jgi:hypothetical protein
MCKDDFAMQLGPHKVSFEQMVKQSKTLFNQLRQAGQTIVEVKRYRFDKTLVCSPEFYNANPKERVLQGFISKIQHPIIRDSTGKVVKKQMISYMNWQLSVVDATRPLDQAEADAELNPLLRAFASQTLEEKEDDDDDAMNG